MQVMNLVTYEAIFHMLVFIYLLLTRFYKTITSITRLIYN